MGTIAVTELTSLEGVMQSPGHTDVPFKYRGWAVDFDSGPEFEQFKLEAQNSEAVLLGRVTYEAMQAFWPTAGGEFADRLNELPKYVVSSTLTDPPWNATVLGAGDRLFGETEDKITLHLVESRPFGGGVVNMTYALAPADG
jgi:hypothetical protein